MSFNEIAISVKNLSKRYEIYDHPGDRLKQFLLPRLRNFLGLNTTKYFREFWALNDVSFEIKKGETVGIIGRNGSGKSTLLQMICGTLTPTNGTVEVTGRIAALLELGSGFNPEFTGRENIYMSASILGLSNDEIFNRFHSIEAFADIGDFIEQPLKTYSSGMVLRLAFAVIANVDADILIIDEALAVGDAFFTQKCMRFLRKFMKHGTILFVSHDTGAVINLCSHAIFLNKGLFKKEGTPKEVTQLYLAELYDSTQEINKDNDPFIQGRNNTANSRDMRNDFINKTSLRNDIEIFDFKSSAPSFGKGLGRIISVRLLDNAGYPLSWIVGGEEISIEIICRAMKSIVSPIIGFYINDKLGQPVFGDNTYLTYFKNSFEISPNQEFSASFEFRMPILPVGDYSVTVALAEGSQADHIQHHWIYDALNFKSHASSVSTGLVGIPMSNIEIRLKGA